MAKGIPVGELDEETRRRIGIPTILDDEPVGKKLIVLGKVFKALKGLTNGEATWVLSQVQGYLQGENGNSLVDFSDLEKEAEAQNYIPPLDWTIQVVARSFELKPSQLKQRGRDEKVVLARQVVMYILWKTDKYTQTQIGQALGGRNASTVCHGFQSIALKICKSPDLSKKVDEIMEKLGGKQ